MKNEFEEHWQKCNYKKVSRQKIRIAKKFLQPVLNRLKNSKKRVLILDAGCGEGIHALVLKEVKKPFFYDGIDISNSAIKRSRRNIGKDRRFRFKQLDIERKKLPQKYDVIICYGMVAYTANPLQVIRRLTSFLNPNGIFIHWIYTPRCWERAALRLLRIICGVGGKELTNVIATLTTAILSYLPVSSGVNLENSTFEQCKETVLINLVPKKLWLPSLKTVRRWHRQAGLLNIKNNLYCLTS